VSNCSTAGLFSFLYFDTFSLDLYKKTSRREKCIVIVVDKVLVSYKLETMEFFFLQHSCHFFWICCIQMHFCSTIKDQWGKKESLIFSGFFRISRQTMRIKLLRCILKFRKSYSLEGVKHMYVVNTSSGIVTKHPAKVSCS
jgi:hypothetical protein